MAIIHKQRVAGGTATIELETVDFTSGLPIVTDSAPTITIYDPRGRPLVSAQQMTALGNGEYFYNYPIPVTATKGFHKAVVNYTVSGVPLAEDVVFQVT